MFWDWSKLPHPSHAHTHAGFNRTGFVVCCYLIECCGLTVDEALDAFATARPPGVKHEAFRAELQVGRVGLQVRVQGGGQGRGGVGCRYQPKLNRADAKRGMQAGCRRTAGGRVAGQADGAMLCSVSMQVCVVDAAGS